MKRWVLPWVTLLTAGLPATVGRADGSHVILSRTDERGGVVHAVPRWNDQVRMAAERVVLVPYYEPSKWQPRLLVHVWYDLRNEGPAAALEVGFPELKALYSVSQLRDVLGTKTTEKAEQHWRLPTILAFSARVGSRFDPVRTYPGLGRYRQWYTSRLALGAGQTARLHHTYLASLGASESSLDPDEDDPRPMRSYFLHYVLHTGARWRGPIGRGEILLYDRGRLRLVRRWKDLEPTVKDDLALSLDLTMVLAHKDPPEQLGPNEWGHRKPSGTTLDRRRLLVASSTLESREVETHVGLAVDGDPGTAWVSAKGRAKGATVQLPSDPGADLTGLRVVSGQPAAGRARPAKMAFQCLSRWKTTLLARADLPDGPGPHDVAVKTPTRCDAVRAEILAVHGDPGAPVSIAELAQRFGQEAFEAEGPFTLVPGPSRADPLAPPRQGPGSKDEPLPKAEDPRAFEEAEIDDVSFSADGSLAHYRLHLEDRRQRPRGLRLGVFVDVSTGKVVRAYRIDREGELPEPYRRLWDEAMTYEEGARLLGRHGFEAAKASRWPPRKGTLPGQRVALAGAAKGEDRALVVSGASRGFTWRYSPRSRMLSGLAEASLALRYGEKGQPERALATHAPRIDRAFAGRHVTVWQARKKIFEKAAEAYAEDQKRVREGFKLDEDTAARWHALSYRHYQAYRGEAWVYWHPKGEALLVAWIDRQDHSGAAPDPEPEAVVPECAELPQKVCDWERRDDDRATLAVTVHALVPRAPTTLLASYQPPPPAPTPAKAGGAMASGAPSKMAASPQAKPGPPKPGKGCGCAATEAPSGHGGAPVAPLLTLLALVVLRRRPGAPPPKK